MHYNSQHPIFDTNKVKYAVTKFRSMCGAFVGMCALAEGFESFVDEIVTMTTLC